MKQSSILLKILFISSLMPVLNALESGLDDELPFSVDEQSVSVDNTCIDYGMMPPLINTSKQRIFLISYAKGEVHKKNQNYLQYSSINKGIDIFIAYRREHIDEEFYQKNKAILDQRRGAGYWLWKPYFILETLKMMHENDILIYLDSGVSVKNSVQPLVDLFNSDDVNIVLFENNHTNLCHVKKDAFDIVGADESCRNKKQMEGGFIALKKNKESIAFMEQWLHYCCIEQAITDTPSKAKEFDEYRGHRHDQALLSLCYYKNPYKIKTVTRHRRPVRNMFHLHRRRIPSRQIPGVSN